MGDDGPTASTDPGSDVFDVVVHDDEVGAIPRELLGTNVPAWLGPERLGDPDLVNAVRDLGVGLVRMPGGSWSNVYDWAGCELRPETECIFAGAARPSDFAALLDATGVEGMWTVSANETAESAAALVAFFNGDIDDGRVIGVDRNGIDWKTVGHWAGVRAAGGYAEPLGVRLWEFGNEVYGGRPEAGGSDCPDFGWEEVWTCDGTAYVVGDDDHDGYLTVRGAMRQVDPTIEVGAVGVSTPDGFGGWGGEVIAASGDDLDFYIVHAYGFDASPDPEHALAEPVDLWRPMVEELDGALDGDVPIAITEYNLVSQEAGDTEQSMIRVVNALYLADSIGQMALAGVEAAAQWNLANGVAASGTDYGLVDADSFAPRPQYHAVRTWGMLGPTLLRATGQPSDVRVYPTQDVDGSVRILVVHTGATERQLSIGFDTSEGKLTGTQAATWADELDATEMVLEEPSALREVDGGLVADLPPYSLSVLEVTGA